MKTREKLAKFLTNPFSIIGLIATSIVLSIMFGGIGTIFGFLVALVTVWAIKWDWSFFGIQKNPLGLTVMKSILFTLFLIVVNDILFQPVIEKFFGYTDLSSLEGLKGNITYYISFILIMWVTAAFGEEFFYRGYMTKRLAVIFGDSQKSWLIAILMSSSIFGFAHLYQGASGVISTGFVGVIMSVIFYRNPENLWVGILTHGFYDVFGITMIFIDKERVITQWAMKYIYFFL